eukprot:185733_1
MNTFLRKVVIFFVSIIWLHLIKGQKVKIHRVNCTILTGWNIEQGEIHASNHTNCTSNESCCYMGPRSSAYYMYPLTTYHNITIEIDLYESIAPPVYYDSRCTVKYRLSPADAWINIASLKINGVLLNYQIILPHTVDFSSMFMISLGNTASGTSDLCLWDLSIYGIFGTPPPTLARSSVYTFDFTTLIGWSIGNGLVEVSSSTHCANKSCWSMQELGLASRTYS